jgi:transposase
MTRRPRRSPNPTFKAIVTLAEIKAERTLIAQEQNSDLHLNQIKQWRDQLLEDTTGVFCDAPKTVRAPVIDVTTLHAKVGETALENYCLSGARRAAR